MIRKKIQNKDCSLLGEIGHNRIFLSISSKYKYILEMPTWLSISRWDCNVTHYNKLIKMIVLSNQILGRAANVVEIKNKHLQNLDVVIIYSIMDHLTFFIISQYETLCDLFCLIFIVIAIWALGRVRSLLLITYYCWKTKYFV